MFLKSSKGNVWINYEYEKGTKEFIIFFLTWGSTTPYLVHISVYNKLKASNNTTFITLPSTHFSLGVPLLFVLFHLCSWLILNCYLLMQSFQCVDLLGFQWLPNTTNKDGNTCFIFIVFFVWWIFFSFLALKIEVPSNNWKHLVFFFLPLVSLLNL